MKTRISGWLRNLVSLLATATVLPAVAALQTVSSSDLSLAPPAGGGGDSVAPLISPDGRYVVFASTANNLVFTTNNVPIPGLQWPTMNVYLRDRTAGTTTLVSVNLAGTGGGNGDSIPRGVSTNGQYVLFESLASDLVAGDTNNQSDVFVRDLVGDATYLVSVNTNGTSGNAASRNSMLTPDGRYVAFASAASDLVTGDTNGLADIFLRDLISVTTTLVSAGAAATNTGPVAFGSSDSPVVTPDGRFVAFFSTATNLVPGVLTPGEVYVRDVAAGTTTWASAAARTLFQILLGTTNVISYNPAVSDNGQFVAFEVSSNVQVGASTRGLLLRYGLSSGLTDLIDMNANAPYQSFANIHNLDMTPDGRFVAFVANDNGISGTTTGIYLWDAFSDELTLVSQNLSGDVPTNSNCAWPAVSRNGQYVAFVSSATNLTANPLLGDFHVYLRDTVAGVTSLVDADTNGIGTGVSCEAVPALSADGRFIAFKAADGNLVANDTNHRDDIFVRDLSLQTNELASVRDPALPCLSPNGSSSACALSVSADDRFVAFASEGDNLTPNDTNGVRDVFVRDLYTGSNVLVSVDTNGVNAADGVSTDPSISADGRYVAFTSGADNLVPGDTNKFLDVFVRDSQTGQTVAVSRSVNGATLGNADSFLPTISPDGRFVLFHSKAGNLVANSSFSAPENLFLRDLVLGTNYALTKSSSLPGASSAAMTPDGRFVVFAGLAGPVLSYQVIYVWDTQTQAYSYTNLLGSAITLVAISPNGQWLAAAGPTGLTVLNVPSNNSLSVSNFGSLSSAHAGLRFSADGRWLVASFGSAATTTNQVFLFDNLAQTNFLITQSYGSGTPAAGASDVPNISPDGRFVVFRSNSTNLVASITNGVPNLFVYDRAAGTTTLLTADATVGGPVDNRSLAPTFSGDGRMIFFGSWASDLASQDFNQRGDAFGFAFLYLTITASVSPGVGPTLSWPVSPGTAYQAQYKDNLSDSTWQAVNGTISITGNRGSITDLAPAVGQRFYRVVAN